MHPFLIPLADVNGAFIGLASLLAGYVAAVLAFVLVIVGYQYMFALEDDRAASKAKRAIGFALVGAIVVALAVGIAPTVLKYIGH